MKNEFKRLYSRIRAGESFSDSTASEAKILDAAFYAMNTRNSTQGSRYLVYRFAHGIEKAFKSPVEALHCASSLGNNFEKYTAHCLVSTL